MIKVENVDVWGFEQAIRGMRNPLNSWEKSDSGVCGDFSVEYKDGQIGCDHKCPKWSPDNYCGYSERLQKFPYDYYMIGKNDLELMQKLYKAGAEHRKYLRQIFVSMDITAPLYWWKEFDTYKVGTVANSCSTMHTIHKKEFELDDFSHDHLYTDSLSAYCPQKMLEQTIKALNFWRYRYLTTNNKSDWWQLIQLLPSSYNQKRTIMMSYEVVFKIIRERSGHKLDEWRDLCEILKNLPYVKEIMGYGEEQQVN